MNAHPAAFHLSQNVNLAGWISLRRLHARPPGNQMGCRPSRRQIVVRRFLPGWGKWRRCAGPRKLPCQLRAANVPPQMEPGNRAPKPSTHAAIALAKPDMGSLAEKLL